MSQRGGTVILSTVRLLLNRSVHVPQFELKTGLRLAPVTATSFATLHRNFASSTNSSGDEQNKLEKHKKTTSSNELTDSEEETKSKSLDEVVMDFCVHCEEKLKHFKDLEFKYRPDDNLAIRAEKFQETQSRVQMQKDKEHTVKYEKFLKPYRDITDIEVQNHIQMKEVKVEESKPEEVKAKDVTSDKHKNKSSNVPAKKFKLFNKIVWNVIKWKKEDNKVAGVPNKSDTPVKKFHSIAQVPKHRNRQSRPLKKH